uniref:Disease resistance protein RPM1 n=1 Tax=Cajanus cajan TaxID=3821 RepID=A0A151QNE5_CAJCA|nr:Disease resistance protein RPM1 [Cajanus cajan]
MVVDIPKEIRKIRKLRYLLGDEISFVATKDCLGSMTFLEKIRVLRVDDEGVVIRELGKLKQLRNMRISGFRAEHTKTLCSSIHEMQFLEVLHIHGDYGHQVIDLPHMSSLSTLRKLFLHGMLKKMPNWISQLQNLVKLSLEHSNLTNDPLESLKDLPNLLFLSMFYAYEGQPGTKIIECKRRLGTSSSSALSSTSLRKIFSKYLPLRVLDFENVVPLNVPKALLNLIHLKYLCFWNSWIKSLPKSIGNLQNLEILDVRRTMVVDIPKEIRKIRKLRYLLGDEISFVATKDCLGSMTFLEKIRVLRVDDEGVVIRELGKLKQLRNMRISGFRAEHTKTLCSSIHEMQFLEVLHIHGDYGHQVIDLPHMSSLSTLRKLFLHGMLKKMPNWISQLQNLVKLSLEHSNLTNDPLESLKDLPNLLFLSMFYAYEGETLYFKDGGFRKLKKLDLNYLFQLNSIFIERGALQSLKELGLNRIPKLRKIPSGIQHLEKLQVLTTKDMPIEFEKSIAGDGGQDHWMIRHVPRVQIKMSLRNTVAKANDMFRSLLKDALSQQPARI